MENQHPLIFANLWYHYQNRFNRMIYLSQRINNNKIIYLEVLFVYRLLITWLTLEIYRLIPKWSGLCMMINMSQIKENGNQLLNVALN